MTNVEMVEATIPKISVQPNGVSITILVQDDHGPKEIK